MKKLYKVCQGFTLDGRPIKVCVPVDACVIPSLESTSKGFVPEMSVRPESSLKTQKVADSVSRVKLNDNFLSNSVKTSPNPVNNHQGMMYTPSYPGVQYTYQPHSGNFQTQMSPGKTRVCPQVEQQSGPKISRVMSLSSPWCSMNNHVSRVDHTVGKREVPDAQSSPANKFQNSQDVSSPDSGIQLKPVIRTYSSSSNVPNKPVIRTYSSSSNMPNKPVEHSYAYPCKSRTPVAHSVGCNSRRVVVQQLSPTSAQTVIYCIPVINQWSEVVPTSETEGNVKYSCVDPSPVVTSSAPVSFQCTTNSSGLGKNSSCSQANGNKQISILSSKRPIISKQSVNLSGVEAVRKNQIVFNPSNKPIFPKPVSGVIQGVPQNASGPAINGSMHNGNVAVVKAVQVTASKSPSGLGKNSSWSQADDNKLVNVQPSTKPIISKINIDSSSIQTVDNKHVNVQPSNRPISKMSINSSSIQADSNKQIDIKPCNKPIIPKPVSGVIQGVPQHAPRPATNGSTQSGSVAVVKAVQVSAGKNPSVLDKNSSCSKTDGIKQIDIQPSNNTAISKIIMNSSRIHTVGNKQIVIKPFNKPIIPMSGSGVIQGIYRNAADPSMNGSTQSGNVAVVKTVQVPAGQNPSVLGKKSSCSHADSSKQINAQPSNRPIVPKPSINSSCVHAVGIKQIAIKPSDKPIFPKPECGVFQAVGNKQINIRPSDKPITPKPGSGVIQGVAQNAPGPAMNASTQSGNVAVKTVDVPAGKDPKHCMPNHFGSSIVKQTKILPKPSSANTATYKAQPGNVNSCLSKPSSKLQVSLCSEDNSKSERCNACNKSGNQRMVPASLLNSFATFPKYHAKALDFTGNASRGEPKRHDNVEHLGIRLISSHSSRPAASQSLCKRQVANPNNVTRQPHLPLAVEVPREKSSNNAFTSEVGCGFNESHPRCKENVQEKRTQSSTVGKLNVFEPEIVVDVIDLDSDESPDCPQEEDFSTSDANVDRLVRHQTSAEAVNPNLCPEGSRKRKAIDDDNDDDITEIASFLKKVVDGIPNSDGTKKPLLIKKERRCSTTELSLLNPCSVSLHRLNPSIMHGGRVNLRKVSIRVLQNDWQEFGCVPSIKSENDQMAGTLVKKEVEIPTEANSDNSRVAAPDNCVTMGNCTIERLQALLSEKVAQVEMLSKRIRK